MKKILIAILIIILIILSYVLIFRGIKIGKFKLNSISEIKKQSQNLDDNLENATKLTAQTFPKSKASLDTAINNLKTTKEQYENKIASISDENAIKYKQIDNYEKEFLWTSIGSYATKENLNLGLNIVDVSNNDYYNLEFTVVGKYSDVADFIYAIENDDKLGFKIEDFTMEPYSVTETTYYKNEEGKTVYKENDYPYNSTIETQFIDNNISSNTNKSTSNQKLSITSNGTANQNTVNNVSDTENVIITNNSNTKANANNTSTTKSNNTKTSSSIVLDPDRVISKFTVKSISINFN